MNYLNLGCGNKYHEDWINADMQPVNNTIVKCNFLDGIPFGENTFDVVYHSHVLEHFSKESGEFFIKECYRILNTKGILRLALPDLEKIANEYLTNLKRAQNEEPGAQMDYDWILLEMYDQTVRNYSGGEMGKYLSNKNIANCDYVKKRIGWEYTEVDASTTTNEENNDTINSNIFRRVKDFIKPKQRGSSFLTNEDDKKAFQIGKFRMAGEIHQWMYDRYSLTRLLQKAGFKDIIVRTAIDSYIDNWASYKLDNPLETASIFIEGIK